jgi:hypothetical protein
MKYLGNNVVGLAMANDPKGEVRDSVLRILNDYLAQAEQSMHSSSLPTTYQRNQAAAQSAAICAEVVKEFHAVCVNAAAGQVGETNQIG